MDQSLNTEALSTLKEDASYLTQPNDKSIPTDSALVIVTQDTDEKNMDAIVASLSEYDVSLQTTEEGITRVHKLDDVSDTILAAESIGQADAEYVAQNFTEFTEKVASPNEFTQMPTKTHLAATQQFIKKAVVDEKSDLVSGFLTHVADQLTYLEALRVSIRHCHDNTLACQLEQLRQEAIEDQAKAGVSNAFLVYRKDKQLIDLKTLTLNHGYYNDDFDTVVPFMPPSYVIQTLISTIDDRDFRDLHWETHLSRHVLLPAQSSERDVVLMSYLDLLGYLASNRLGQFMEDVMTLIDQECATVCASVEAIRQDDLSMGNKLELIEKVTPALRENLKHLITFYRYQTIAKPFVYNAGLLMSYFRKQFGQ